MNSAFTRLQDNQFHRYYLVGVPCGACDVPANFHDELPVSKSVGLAICHTYLLVCRCTESKFVVAFHKICNGYFTYFRYLGWLSLKNSIFKLPGCVCTYLVRPCPNPLLARVTTCV